MKYLHENDVDTGTHQGLDAVIEDINTQAGVSPPSYYCELQDSPVIEGQQCIPIINSTVESYLTSSEKSTLVDTDDYTLPRSGDIPTNDDWTKILIRCCEQWEDSDLDIPQNPFPSFTHVPSWETNNDRIWQFYKLTQTYNGGVIRELGKGFYYTGAAFNISNIESGGDVLFFYGRKSNFQNLVFWAKEFDYPGNPWHISNNPDYAKALMRRAVISASVEMCMLWDSGNHDHYRWCVYAHLGRIFYNTKDFMPKMMRDAFEEGLKQCYYEYLEDNHYGLQSTLDQDQRLGVLFWALSTDPSLREFTLDVFKEKSMYNFKYGKYAEHSLDHDGDIDFSYQGRTERRAFWSYIVGQSLGISQSDHIKEWFDRFGEFRLYQLLPDPDGSFQGPTGTNAGTPDNDYNKQGVINSILLSLALKINNYKYLSSRYGLIEVPTVTEMKDLIEAYATSSYNNDLFDESKVTSSLFPSWGLSTTMYNDQIVFNFIEEGEYNQLLTITEEEKKVKYEKADDFIKKIGDALFVKLNSGNSDELGVQFYLGDKGFRDEGNSSSTGTISGFQGGWSCLWTKSTGIVGNSLSRGNQSPNADRIDGDNDYNYYAGAIGGWAHNHIGFRMTNGKVMSTALVKRTYDNIAYNIDGNSITEDVFESSNPTSFEIIATTTMASKYDYYQPNGVIDVEEKYNGDSTGITVEKTLNADSTAQANNDIDEGWEYLPLSLQSDRSFITGTVELRQSGTWSSPAEGTLETGVEALRVTRNGVSAYYVPDATVHPNGWDIKFYSGGWQTDRDVDTLAIAGIDLHGDAGTSKALPSQVKVKYKFQMDEPALS